MALTLDTSLRWYEFKSHRFTQIFTDTPAEIAAIGNLTAGTEYAFSVGVDPAAETTDIDFRFVRDEDCPLN